MAYGRASGAAQTRGRAGTRLELRKPQHEQRTELGGRMERIGKHGAALEWERGARLAVDLRHE